MTYFDLLAEEDLKITPAEHDWLLAASRARKDVNSPQELTVARNQFLQQHGILNPDEKNHQGKTQPLPYQTIRRDKNVLQPFPRYSARLLLEFTLLTPLITTDDEPFYLCDNPACKEPIFGVYYLSATTIKGLSADAYQCAFSSESQIELEPENQRKLADLIRGFRAQDDKESALRLFGIADDGTNTDPNHAGRLHFSPVCFKEGQFCVMNPTEPETATGDHPIQFEAIAPKQTGVLEIVYFNPYGADNSDEQTIRDDLAQWLAAVAVWWPVLGLGAKRQAGYGAIQIEKATLQAVDWSGRQIAKTQQNKTVVGNKPPPKLPPSYYEEYLDAEGKPITEAALEVKIAPQLAKMAAKIDELELQWQKAGGKAKKTTKKGWENHIKSREFYACQEGYKHKKVIKYWQRYGHIFKPASMAEIPSVVVEDGPIYERREEGEDSWINLARWIAGEK
ncbi:MAG TPA: hypothetical protein ENI48_02315 [Thioploca sp.]|nr:hypothetical protein [Thioploca sp.]